MDKKKKRKSSRSRSHSGDYIVHHNVYPDGHHVDTVEPVQHKPLKTKYLKVKPEQDIRNDLKEGPIAHYDTVHVA